MQVLLRWMIRLGRGIVLFETVEDLPAKMHIIPPV